MQEASKLPRCSCSPHLADIGSPRSNSISFHNFATYPSTSDCSLPKSISWTVLAVSHPSRAFIFRERDGRGKLHSRQRVVGAGNWVRMLVVPPTCAGSQAVRLRTVEIDVPCAQNQAGEWIRVGSREVSVHAVSGIVRETLPCGCSFLLRCGATTQQRASTA